jgi:hypothetical protein
MNMSLFSRIDSRIKLLSESTAEDIKDVNSPEYSRVAAEDLLYNTIGPLTSMPRYSNEWKARGGTRVPEGFVPGGPAPRWTPNEITIAMAGDPELLGSKATGNPKHPASGMGSPIYRKARRIATHYKKMDILDDLYGNGLVQLAEKMRAGEDEGRGAFISWVMKPIESAMLNGVGSSLSIDLLLGIMGTSYIGPNGEIQRVLPKDPAVAKQFTKQTLYGIQGIKNPSQVKGINLKTPDGLRRAASVVQGKFRQENSEEKSPGNPFRPFSASYYKVVTELADAIESRDASKIEQAYINLDQLEEMAQDATISTLGASTGIGQAITNKDRSKTNRISILKMNVNREDLADALDMISTNKLTKIVDKDEDSIMFSMAAPVNQVNDMIQKLSKYGSAIVVRSESTGRVVSADSSEDEEATSLGSTLAAKEVKPSVDSDIIQTVLQKALTEDAVGLISKTPRFKEKVLSVVSDINRRLDRRDLDIEDLKGKLTATQYRYLLRTLGDAASNYPGKGNYRQNTSITRDEPSKAWWQPGEDPEIESLDEYGGEGTWESLWMREGQPRMGPTEIAEEMTREGTELKELGIPTKKTTASKQSVNTHLAKALGKFMLIRAIYSEQLGLEESKQYDTIDRRMILEGTDFIINRLRHTLLTELLRSFK